MFGLASFGKCGSSSGGNRYPVTFLPVINSDGRISLGSWEDARVDDILIPDHEGIFRAIPGTDNAIVTSGAIPIENARVVQNLASDTEDWSTGFTNPDGISWANGIATADGFAGGWYKQFTVIPNDEYVFSYEAYNIDFPTFKYAVYDATHSAWIVTSTAYDTKLEAGDRVGISFTVPDGCLLVRLYPLRDSTSGSYSCYLNKLQLENVSSQTNQAPSEYISDSDNYGFGYYATENRLGITQNGSVAQLEGHLIGVGDSLVSGSTDEGSPVDMLSHKIAFATVTNNAVDGRTLEQVDTAFNTDAVVAGADAIFLLIADMHTRSSDPITAMQTALQSIITQCNDNSITPIICNHTPFGNHTGWTAARQEWTDTWNAWIETYADTNSIAFVDAWSLLVESGTNNLASEYDSGDGLHLLEAGYDVIGSAAAAAFGYDYVGDALSPVPTLVHYIAETNTVIGSRDFSGGGWSKTGTGAATIDAVGFDGSLTGGSTLTDTDASNSTYYQSADTITSDTDVYQASVYIGKDNDESRFVAIRSVIFGGGSADCFYTINTKTGAVTDVSSAGTYSITVNSYKNHWHVILLVTNSNGTSWQFRIYPAFGSVAGTANVATTGSCIADQADKRESQSAIGLPITTTVASDSRDSCVIRHPIATYFNQTAFTVVCDFESDTAQASFTTTDEGIVSVAESATNLLFLDSGGFKSADGTSTATVDPTLLADTKWRAIVHGISGGNFQVSEKDLGTPGAWTHGTPTSYDGAFTSGSWINIGYGCLHNLVIYKMDIYLNDMTTGQIEELV